MIKNPLVSIIMPVYNVQDYLSEAIDSILCQSIGFEENIELIIVNDGSTDRSGEIIQKYVEKYPNNILCVTQKNGGLSAARYTGFNKARGRYLHSMDSDDTISRNFHKKTTDFLDKNSASIDFVASPIKFFEARQGDHYLNRRFRRKSRIIHIKDEPTAFQYHLASVVLKRSAVRKEWFDKKISIAEDARLISILLKEKKRYGVVSGVAYNYRIREAGGSLINTQHKKYDYYTETPKRFWQYILDYWKDDNGEVEQYIQNLVMNDIRWRINEQKNQDLLGKTEEAKYKEFVYSVISQIDDNVIINQEGMGLYKKIHLLKRKYGNKFDRKISAAEGKILINHQLLIDDPKKYFGLVVDFINPEQGSRLSIEGYPVNDSIHSDGDFFIKTSKGDHKLKRVERARRRKDGFLGDSFHQYEAFETEIDIAEVDSIEAFFRIKNVIDIAIPIHTKRFTRISNAPRSGYRVIDCKILRLEKGLISVYKNTLLRRVIFESIFCIRIIANIRLRHAIKMQNKSFARILYDAKQGKVSSKGVKSIFIPGFFLVRNLGLNIISVFLRIIYNLKSRDDKKPIWLISDRGIAAGDNGEAFFEYLSKIDNLPIDARFVISKKSPDYKRIASIGRVVNIDSILYKVLFLHADKIISSQADEYIINPFGAREGHLLDLFTFDFVFLSHGVTKNDISDWLNRFHKNIKLFVSVADSEYSAFFSNPYYYSENEIALTGFPRFDKLKTKPSGKVMLAPTWRKYLTNGKIAKNGKWAYQEDFKNSEYFQFYNKLINDRRLLAALKDTNMTAEFYLHPSHSSQIKDFKGNDWFKIMDFPFNYTRAFNESNMLITDYSSLHFDFSYLRKPVIYTQFDRDYYFENHGVYDRGYYSEVKDGFGPVAEDYESTVKEIIKTIHSGCMIRDKYRRRVDNFYAYNDNNNSERVYREIQKMGNRNI